MKIDKSKGFKLVFICFKFANNYQIWMQLLIKS